MLDSVLGRGGEGRTQVIIGPRGEYWGGGYRVGRVSGWGGCTSPPDERACSGSQEVGRVSMGL
jgi:hypothetical protein